MSSWYVENLIKSRSVIRKNIIVDYPVVTEEPAYLQNLEDDEYTSLLAVEDAIKELIETKVFSKKEEPVIKLLVEGYYSTDIAKLLGLSRQTATKLVRSSCDKIVEHLGRDFSDEGYLSILSEKFKLDAEQLEKARNFMTSNKRNNYLRSKN